MFILKQKGQGGWSVELIDVIEDEDIWKSHENEGCSVCEDERTSVYVNCKYLCLKNKTYTTLTPCMLHPRYIVQKLDFTGMSILAYFSYFIKIKVSL